MYTHSMSQKGGKCSFIPMAKGNARWFGCSLKSSKNCGGRIVHGNICSGFLDFLIKTHLKLIILVTQPPTCYRVQHYKINRYINMLGKIYQARYYRQRKVTMVFISKKASPKNRAKLFPSEKTAITEWSITVYVEV